MGQGWLDILSLFLASYSAPFKQQQNKPIISTTLNAQHTKTDFGVQGLHLLRSNCFSRSIVGWAVLSVEPAR